MPAAAQPDPETLIQHARGGDGRAVGQLLSIYRQYFKLLARLHIDRRMQPKMDASDIVQELLLQAHRAFPRFRGTTEAEWLAWLRRILAHNAANFVRQYRGTGKRQVNREVPLAGGRDSSRPAGAFDPSDGGETPSQQLIRREKELQMADALARLPADCQEVIVLRNLQRLPFDAVARSMGRSRPAVQMLWMRAIQKLQETMKEEG